LRSYVLNVVAREIAVVDMISNAVRVSGCPGLLPVGSTPSRVARYEDVVGGGEPVELLQVVRAALALERLQEDQVLSVLESGELDVLHRLEEG
jgi:hypothetical protein